MVMAAGVVFVACALVLVVFQIGLALGAPWGVAAYGGGHPGTLPAGLRVLSAAAGFVIYPFMAVFVVGASGIADTGLGGAASTGRWLWVLTGFFAVGTIMNLASRSRIERIWAPVSLVLAACCAVLAAGM